MVVIFLMHYPVTTATQITEEAGLARNAYDAGETLGAFILIHFTMEQMFIVTLDAVLSRDQPCKPVVI
jgi:hypothetical protein